MFYMSMHQLIKRIDTAMPLSSHRAGALLLLSLILSTSYGHAPLSDNTHASTHRPSISSKKGGDGSCYKGDLVCEKDRLGYAAISSLHAQMDDDNDGDIDLEESVEYLREELQYNKAGRSDTDSRSKKFHANDTHISVDDLWNRWKDSSVHNWTVAETENWLIHHVELPQYVETFRNNAVDGSTLPRIAVNSLNFVSNILGIKSLVHKQKLALKATDVVLFGPPKYTYSHTVLYTSLCILVSLLLGIIGWWYRFTSPKIKRLENVLDSLNSIEEENRQLQMKLEEKETEKKRLADQHSKLTEEMRSSLSGSSSKELKDRLASVLVELEQTQEDLRVAEKALAARGNSPGHEVQRWLQLTYEIELRYYQEKANQVDTHFNRIKDECERLKKKKMTLLGTIRAAHNTSIDDLNSKIAGVRHAREELHHDHQEQQYRWQQMENICGFAIVSNPGLHSLIKSMGHADLYRYTNGGAKSKLFATDNSSTDGQEDPVSPEDVPPNCTVISAAHPNGFIIKKRSVASLHSINPSSTVHLVHGVTRSGVAKGSRFSSHRLADSDNESNSEFVQCPEPTSATNGHVSSRHKMSAHSSSFSSLPSNKPSPLATESQASRDSPTAQKLSTVSSEGSTDRPVFALLSTSEEKSISTGNIPESVADSTVERRRPPLVRESAFTSQSCTMSAPVDFRSRSNTGSEIDFNRPATAPLPRSLTQGGEMQHVLLKQPPVPPPHIPVLTDSCDSLQSAGSLDKPRKSSKIERFLLKIKRNNKSK